MGYLHMDHCPQETPESHPPIIITSAEECPTNGQPSIGGAGIGPRYTPPHIALLLLLKP